MKSKVICFKKYAALILLTLASLSSSCKNENIDIHSRGKINPVYDQKNPIKGEIELKLEKKIEIDPSLTNLPGDLLFDNFWRDTDGSIYIFDYKNFHLYKFDNRGNEAGVFLKKGEGPGEILSYPQIQFSNHFLWIIAGKKIVTFKKNGEFIKEHKLKDFYFSLHMLSEERFIAGKLVPMSHNSNNIEYSKDLSIYDLNTEQGLINIFSSSYNGRLYINVGNRRMAVIPNPGIVPDIVYGFDVLRRRIYLAENNKYKIYLKDFNGNLKMVFSRSAANTLLTVPDKIRIAEGITSIPNFSKLIRDALPDQLCSIEKILLFSNGYIGVYHIKGYERFELDIFDPGGKFLYVLKLPGDFKPYRFKFSEDILGVLNEKGDVMVYREYFVKPLSDILRNTGKNTTEK